MILALARVRASQPWPADTGAEIRCQPGRWDETGLPGGTAAAGRTTKRRIAVGRRVVNRPRRGPDRRPSVPGVPRIKRLVVAAGSHRPNRGMARPLAAWKGPRVAVWLRLVRAAKPFPPERAWRNAQTNGRRFARQRAGSSSRAVPPLQGGIEGSRSISLYAGKGYRCRCSGASSRLFCIPS